MEAFARALVSSGTYQEEQTTTLVTALSEAQTDEMTPPALERVTDPRAFAREMTSPGERPRRRSRSLRPVIWLTAALVGAGVLAARARSERTPEASSTGATLSPSPPANQALGPHAAATAESEPGPLPVSFGDAVGSNDEPSAPSSMPSSHAQREGRQTGSPAPSARATARPRSRFEREPATGLPVATEW
jgi:hypothetical protein